MRQGGRGGLRGPAAVAAGSTFEVEVEGPADDVEVSEGGGGEVERIPVPAGRKVTLQAPAAPGGTLLVVTIGRGLRTKVLLVEVVSK